MGAPHKSKDSAAGRPKDAQKRQAILEAARAQFLAHAVKLAAQARYRIVNVDTTVVLERPKLRDYRLPIRESLARTLGLERGSCAIRRGTGSAHGPEQVGISARNQRGADRWGQIT